MSLELSPQARNDPPGCLIELHFLLTHSLGIVANQQQRHVRCPEAMARKQRYETFRLLSLMKQRECKRDHCSKEEEREE